MLTVARRFLISKRIVKGPADGKIYSSDRIKGFSRLAARKHIAPLRLRNNNTCSHLRQQAARLHPALRGEGGGSYGISRKAVNRNVGMSYLRAFSRLAARRQLAPRRMRNPWNRGYLRPQVRASAPLRAVGLPFSRTDLDFQTNGNTGSARGVRFGATEAVLLEGLAVRDAVV
jgi:hypothetical protein